MRAKKSECGTGLFRVAPQKARVGSHFEHTDGSGVPHQD